MVRSIYTLIALSLAACAPPPPPAMVPLVVAEAFDATPVADASAIAAMTPAVSAAPVLPMPLARVGFEASAGPAVWQVHAGERLTATLRRWGGRAGMDVFWEACPGGQLEGCIDWESQRSARFTGDFGAALAWLLSGHSSARPRPRAELSDGAVRILADG